MPPKRKGKKKKGGKPLAATEIGSGAAAEGELSVVLTDGTKRNKWQRSAKSVNESEKKQKMVDSTNVRYSKREDSSLKEALNKFKASSGIDDEALKNMLKQKVVRQKKTNGSGPDEVEFQTSSDELARKTWTQIIELADVSSRTNNSCYKKLKRLMWGDHGAWTKEDEEALKKEYERLGPKWSEMIERFQCSPEDLREKWLSMQRTKTGKWSKDEEDALWKGVRHVTGSLAPKGRFSGWSQVKTYVPQRSKEQCRHHWYFQLLPTLQYWENAHGIAIPFHVFERVIVRNMVKKEYDDEEEVDWINVNTFWTSQRNRDQWEHLQKHLPNRERPFEERLAFIADILKINDHKESDRDILRTAKMPQWLLQQAQKRLGLSKDDVDAA